jgi:hypothetical protein
LAAFCLFITHQFQFVEYAAGGIVWCPATIWTMDWVRFRNGSTYAWNHHDIKFLKTIKLMSACVSSMSLGAAACVWRFARLLVRTRQRRRLHVEYAFVTPVWPTYPRKLRRRCKYVHCARIIVGARMCSWGFRPGISPAMPKFNPQSPSPGIY